MVSGVALIAFELTVGQLLCGAWYPYCLYGVWSIVIGSALLVGGASILLLAYHRRRHNLTEYEVR